MDKKTRTRIYLSILAGILLSGPAILPLFAQEIPPAEVTDTSYFKTGDDDWNLVESVLRGNPDALFLLLQRGADPNATAEGGMTALMFAVERGDLRLVKLLVLNGAELELTYLEKTTPLLIAVLNNHFEVAQFLLEKGADPDHKDQFDGSALLYAAAQNNYQIADLLLFYGAGRRI